ncbi:2-keto-4-pentenoate hydratase [Novosphingobium terrae]|uniref:2-keto-4-pentenoate hydratase n=1 Tax=Novosphingobium terrae TaxID=2726189 RepID=UPI00197F16A9|nr:2-keto-4-pentenoate hydratase [Novosphingobium terrae]
MSVEIDRLEIDKVASAFVQARRDATGLATYPGTKPQDMAEAYAIQNRALALEDRTVVGWKVGRVPPPHVERLGTDRLAGPIFADTVIWAAPGAAPEMPVFAEGFAAVEAEFMAHVAPGFTGAVPADDAGTLAILDDLRIGIEIASSPYPGINEDGPTVTVSDFGNNHGLILGAVLEGWRTLDLRSLPLSTAINGEIVGEATAAAMLDGPLGAVRFLLANLIERGIDTSKGLWVSTGAVTGVHAIAVGQSATASFGPYGQVSCRIVAAKAR